MASTTKCIICGKDYTGCYRCNSKNLTPWKTLTDTIEHYQIFQILNGYGFKTYTADEAKEKLDNVEYDISELLPEIQEQIKKLEKEAKKKTDEKHSNKAE